MRRITFDLDVLRSFTLGVELGSFAKAAERLGRSTSAVSAQLKKLEEQVGAPVLRKSGRNMVPTPTGEVLIAYARRLLELNDEASHAVNGTDLEGALRLGVAEDFAEALLANVLGSFARAHPRVRVEARIARNVELIDQIERGKLDLALAWDVGRPTAHARRVGSSSMCWIGSPMLALPQELRDEPVPLAVMEAPCLMRTAAIGALDKAGIPWRIAFSSPSLGGVWAAVEAGLGVTVRTRAVVPPGLDVRSGLPRLPQVRLNIHRSEAEPSPAARRLEALLMSQLSRSMTAGRASAQS
jgi:DNA-binding transcriptional LysR family regulator